MSSTETTRHLPATITATAISGAHVEHRPGRRYPYLPVCQCGTTFRGYVTRDAAQNVADDHQCP